MIFIYLFICFYNDLKSPFFGPWHLVHKLSRVLFLTAYSNIEGFEQMWPVNSGLVQYYVEVKWCSFILKDPKALFIVFIDIDVLEPVRFVTHGLWLIFKGITVHY